MYNGLKIRVLGLLAERGGYVSPREVAVRTFSVRADDGVWFYMARLARWGLVRRRERPWGVEYAITKRGRERLAWLTRFS
jgi:hypothetical protein